MKRSNCVILILLLASITSVQAQSKPWPVPQNALNIKNPLTGDAAAVNKGKALYLTYCAPCHGSSGRGDGPAAAALTVKPANHTSSTVQAEPEGSLFYKISEGRAPMPQFKNTLSEAQRWSLVTYIKTLRK